MFFPSIRQSCESLGLRMTFFGAIGTSPFLTEEGDYVRDLNSSERKAFDDARLAFLEHSKPRITFISARWTNYYNWSEENFANHLQRLREACGSSQLIFLGQPPELPFGSERFTSGILIFPALRKYYEFPAATIARRKIHQRLQQFCASTSHCHFIETESYFLRDGHPYFIEGETLFYHDDDHLSVAGALRVVPAIDEILTRLK